MAKVAGGDVNVTRALSAYVNSISPVEGLTTKDIEEGLIFSSVFFVSGYNQQASKAWGI